MPEVHFQNRLSIAHQYACGRFRILEIGARPNSQTGADNFSFHIIVLLINESDRTPALHGVIDPCLQSPFAHRYGNRVSFQR